MTTAFQPATRGRVIGRVVGEQAEHITVAMLGSHLVAVRDDGEQYAVWTWGVAPDDTIYVQWGHYYDTAHYPDAYTAFQVALAKMAALES